MYFFFDNDFYAKDAVLFVRKLFSILGTYLNQQPITEVSFHVFKGNSEDDYTDLFSGETIAFEQTADPTYTINHLNSMDMLCCNCIYFIKPGQIKKFWKLMSNSKYKSNRSLKNIFIEPGEFICDCEIPAHIENTEYYKFSVKANELSEQAAIDRCCQLIYFKTYTNEYSFNTYFENREDISFVKYWQEAGFYSDDYALFGYLCDEVIDDFFNKPHKAKLYKNGNSPVIILDEIFTKTDKQFDISTDFMIGIHMSLADSKIMYGLKKQTLEFLEEITDLSMEKLEDIFQ